MPMNWLSSSAKKREIRDDSDSIAKFGSEVVSDMSRKLLEQGAPGIHFCTMNQSESSLAIWDNIK